jgi:hypothetical protein
MQVPRQPSPIESSLAGPGPSITAAGVAVLAAALLAGCAAETTYGARAFAVQGKFDWKSCEELAAMRKSTSAQIESSLELQRRAERESFGTVIGAAAYGPALAQARADRKIIDEAIAEKQCPPPK